MKYVCQIVTFTVVLIICGCTVDHENDDLRLAEMAASEVQRICNSDNKCPDKVKGWKSVDGMYTQMLILPSGTKLLYGVNGEKNEFVIFMRYSLGKGLLMQGGVGKKVEKKEFSS